MFISGVLAVFLPSPSAGATSAYDGVVQNTQTLEVNSYPNHTLYADLTTSLWSKINSECTNGADLQSDFTSNATAWAIVNNKRETASSSYNDSIIVVWTHDEEPADIYWNPYVYQANVLYDSYALLYLNDNGSWYCSGDYDSYDAYQQIGRDPHSLSTGYPFSYVSTFPVVYPEDYEGIEIADGSADVDGDGLSVLQESIQSTSDTDMDKDTDNDGIDDLKESRWFEDRDEVFCDTVPDPDVCAYPDPLKKDVYVEIDWMDDSTTEYKPTSTQLGLVVDMFDDQDINLHFDTGQYGGGQELSTYTSPLLRIATPSEVDYFDYKSGGDSISASFSTDRSGIWHYLISGDTYTDDVDPKDSSGWANVMGSNIFISLGYVLDAGGVVSQDRAVANTIAHEIGHNLCLSPDRVYFEQPVSCVYAGIDNNNSENDYYNIEDYESVMNYRYQLTDQDDFGVVDYSDGGNAPDDHDDWASAISGLGKFNASRTLYTEFGAQNNRSSNSSSASNLYDLDPEGNVIIIEGSSTLDS